MAILEVLTALMDVAGIDRKSGGYSRWGYFWLMLGLSIFGGILYAIAG